MKRLHRVLYLSFVFVVFMSFGFAFQSPALAAGNSGAIEQAQEMGRSFKEKERLSEEIKEKGEEFNLSYFGPRNYWLKDFLIRVHKNKALRNAVLRAKEMEVWIYVDKKFEIGNGYVLIDHHASDEEITKFLVEGK